MFLRKKSERWNNKKTETEVQRVKGLFLQMDKEGEGVCGSKRAKCFIASGGEGGGALLKETA